MRVNLTKVRVIRASEDGNVKLIARNLNQHACYYVVVYGSVAHQGNYKWCSERFNDINEASPYIDFA